MMIWFDLKFELHIREMGFKYVNGHGRVTGHCTLKTIYFIFWSQSDHRDKDVKWVNLINRNFMVELPWWQGCQIKYILMYSTTEGTGVIHCVFMRLCVNRCLRNFGTGCKCITVKCATILHRSYQDPASVCSGITCFGFLWELKLLRSCLILCVWIFDRLNLLRNVLLDFLRLYCIYVKNI